MLMEAKAWMSVSTVRDTSVRMPVNKVRSSQQHQRLDNRWVPIENVQLRHSSFGRTKRHVYCGQRRCCTRDSSTPIEKLLEHLPMINGHIDVCANVFAVENMISSGPSRRNNLTLDIPRHSMLALESFNGIGTSAQSHTRQSLFIVPYIYLTFLLTPVAKVSPSKISTAKM